MPEVNFNLNERLAALESMFAKVNLGDYSNDQDVPPWVAMRINPAFQVYAEALAAVHLAAQVKLGRGAQSEAASTLMSDIIDEWCGTPAPGRFPPRPRWGQIIEQLGALAERLPAGSIRREAAFELSRRVVERAHELGSCGQ